MSFNPYTRPPDPVERMTRSLVVAAVVVFILVAVLKWLS